jgi:vancomycin resistance protein VanJ
VKRKYNSFSWINSLAVTYVIAVLIAWFLLARLADRWWPASVLLFGPRWVLLLPAFVLIPWALLRRRWRTLLALAFAAIVVAWPLMGWNWSGMFRNVDGQRDVRIITFNIGNNNRMREHIVKIDEVRRLFDVSRADVLVLQECSLGRDELFPYFPDAQLLSINSICAVSRWSLSNVESRPNSDLRTLGGNGVIISFDVETARAKFTVLALHLATQRDGLQEVLSGSLASAESMQRQMRARRLDSGAALTWSLRSPLPSIIVGDFNMPVESGIYKDRWRAYGNAFTDCGFGYGYTKFERRFGIRIDHVLYDRVWRCLAAEIDQSMGGDHRPLIDDLQLRR